MMRLGRSGWKFLQVDTTVASLPSAAVADVLTLLAEYMPECPHLEFILKWLRLLCLKHGSCTTGLLPLLQHLVEPENWPVAIRLRNILDRDAVNGTAAAHWHAVIACQVYS